LLGQSEDDIHTWCDGQGTIFSYIPIFVVRPTPEDPGPVLFPLTVSWPFPSWNRSHID
jgi:hypothetical protein